MTHFDPERYSRLVSPIHRWEPRARVLSLFVLIFSVALAESILQAFAGLCISFALILISRLPLAHVSRFMKWPALFLLPLVILLPFTAGGDRLSAVPFFSLSSQGIQLGLLFLIRGLGAALLALLIMSTAPFTATIRALQDLGLPSPLTQIFLFAYRYVFLLNEELLTMSHSMNCRGFVKRSDLKTARILAMAFAMLLIRSYERSEGVFNAMLSRGYQGELTGSRRRKILNSDFIKSFLVVGAALGVHAL